MHADARVAAVSIVNRFTKTANLLDEEIKRCCQELKLESPPDLSYAIYSDCSFRIGLTSGSYIPVDFEKHSLFLIPYIQGMSKVKIIQRWSELGKHEGFDEEGRNKWEEIEAEIPESTVLFLNHLLKTGCGFETDSRQIGGFSPKDEDRVDMPDSQPCFGYIKFGPFSKK